MAPAMAENTNTYTKNRTKLGIDMSLITGADATKNIARTMKKELVVQVRKMLLGGY
jgi:hypothetical protein